MRGSVATRGVLGEAYDVGKRHWSSVELSSHTQLVYDGIHVVHDEQLEAYRYFKSGGQEQWFPYDGHNVCILIS